LANKETDGDRLLLTLKTVPIKSKLTGALGRASGVGILQMILLLQFTKIFHKTYQKLKVIK
jgi:hypothetical protein